MSGMGTGARDAADAPSGLQPVAGESAEKWTRRFNEGATPSTSDDQSRTHDGRVLDTKESMVAFLNELNARRHAEHRSLSR